MQILPYLIYLRLSWILDLHWSGRVVANKQIGAPSVVMNPYSVNAFGSPVFPQHFVGNSVLEVLLAQCRRENVLTDVFRVVHNLLNIGVPKQVDLRHSICL